MVKRISLVLGLASALVIAKVAVIHMEVQQGLRSSAEMQQIMNTIYHTVIVGLAIYYAIITMGALIGAIGALITIAILRRRQKRLSNPVIAEATKAL